MRRKGRRVGENIGKVRISKANNSAKKEKIWKHFNKWSETEIKLKMKYKI